MSWGDNMVAACTYCMGFKVLSLFPATLIEIVVNTLISMLITFLKIQRMLSKFILPLASKTNDSIDLKILTNSETMLVTHPPIFETLPSKGWLTWPTKTA